MKVLYEHVLPPTKYFTYYKLVIG